MDHLISTQVPTTITFSTRCLWTSPSAGYPISLLGSASPPHVWIQSSAPLLQGHRKSSKQNQFLIEAVQPPLCRRFPPVLSPSPAKLQGTFHHSDHPVTLQLHSSSPVLPTAKTFDLQEGIQPCGPTLQAQAQTDTQTHRHTKTLRLIYSVSFLWCCNIIPQKW